jgi:hypothetical protein
MHPLALLAALLLILGPLVDCFETILQPRRVTHRFRFARTFYRSVWAVWRGVARGIRSGKRRQAFLSLFGPLSLLALFAAWVCGLIFGFALLHWGLRSPLQNGPGTFATDLYLSGTTFFTLGYGDVTPTHLAGRALAVMEAGLGFAFLAVIVSYLPVLYQAFSRREATISLLDARAGSPPSAVQFLLRLAAHEKLDAVDTYLAEWERWSAELLESNLSFPVLIYYRSQHDNQSWLATLAMMLDTCALLMAQVKCRDTYHAELTFAMARHAAVDLALVVKTPPVTPTHDRFPPEQRRRAAEALRAAGVEIDDAPDVDARLAALRGTYEPFIYGLAKRFLFDFPPIGPEGEIVDNWQRSGFMPRPPGIGALVAQAASPSAPSADDHHF